MLKIPSLVWAIQFFVIVFFLWWDVVLTPEPVSIKSWLFAPCWPFVPTILLFVSINLNCSVFHIELFIFMLYLCYDINQVLFLSMTNIPLCTCVHMCASACTHSSSFVSCMFGLLPPFTHCKRHWCEHEYINICSSLFLILLCVIER